MLDRTQFVYCSRLRLCALAKGPETVEIWGLPESLEARASGGTAATWSEPLQTLETRRSRIEGLAFVGPRHLLTVHELGGCAVWELPERSDSSALETSENAAKDGENGRRDGSGPQANEVWSTELGLDVCAFRSRSSDGAVADRCAVGGRSGAVVLLAFEDGGEPDPIVAGAEGHHTDVTSFAFAPRSERLASGGRDNEILVWQIDPERFEDAPAEAEGASTESGTAEGAAADAGGKTDEDSGAAGDAPEASDPAGSNETSGGGEGGEAPADATLEETRVSLPGRRLPDPLRLSGSEGWPVALEFSGDGTRLASTALDNSLYLWDPRAEDPLQAVVNRHDNWVTELAWSPDDSILATGSWDTSAGIFEAAKLTPRYKFEVHTDFVSGLIFLPDSEQLVTASYDGTLAIWNWKKGALEARFRAHSDWIEVLVAVGDGRVLTVSSENVVRIWDVESHAKLAELGDASFEGFDLGREVDFSDYVEVPELSSDSLEESERAVGALETVKRLSGGHTGGPDSGSGPSDTAVGLLEDAIEQSGRAAGDPAPVGEGEETRREGAKMLDARLDGASTSQSEPTSASEKFIAESSSEEPSQGPGGGEEEEVERAFAEISEVEVDAGDAGTGTPASPGDESGGTTGSAPTKEIDVGAQSNTAPREGDGATSEGGGASERESPTEKIDAEIDDTASSESESIDQFGAPIDERIEDASLDMPDDIDTSEGDFEGEGRDVGRTGSSRDETSEPDAGAAEPGASPTSDPSPSRLADGPSPQLGRPATEQSSERLDAVESGGERADDAARSEARGREHRDTMTASGSDIASNMHTPDEGSSDSRDFTGEERRPNTDVRGRPGASGTDPESDESSGASASDAGGGRGSTRRSPKSASTSGETTVDSEEDAESSLSADDLKAKFEKLKEKKAELDEKRDRDESEAASEDDAEA